jgi:hypothetical protein
MAKPPEAASPAPTSSRLRVLPMQRQLGDRLVEERAEWQVIGRPYTTAGGKTANVRVKRVESGAEMIRVWGAHERVTVKRTGGTS